MKIFPLKSKVMAFERQVQIRTRFVIENATLEQVSAFIHLKCKILNKEEEDMT
jgi:hypothetical protein